MQVDRPYSRGEYGRALLVNAATEPFNALLLAGVLIAGFALGRIEILGPIAVVIYGIAVARTFFDKEEAEKVLAEERVRRRGKPAERLDPGTLAPEIAARVAAARARQDRIAQAIERADLPYTEVSAEVDAFVRAMDGTAQRAQLLWEALDETPVADVRRRLKAAADKPELREALTQQLAVLERMGAQLQRFYDEMDRMTVELDTIRGNLVSVSATTEADAQRRLAEEVRGMRDELGAVAAGIDEAYED